MLGIHHPDSNVLLQAMVDRHPIHAGAFHDDLSTASGSEPAVEITDISGHGPKGADRFVHATVGILVQATDSDELLMHVDARAARLDNVHRQPPHHVSDHRPGTAYTKRLVCVLPRSRQPIILPFGALDRLRHRLTAPHGTALRPVDTESLRQVLRVGKRRQQFSYAILWGGTPA